MTVHQKFDLAEVAGIFAKEANVWCTRRHEVPRPIADEKRSSLDQGEALHVREMRFCVEEARFRRWRYRAQSHVFQLGFTGSSVGHAETMLSRSSRTSERMPVLRIPS